MTRTDTAIERFPLLPDDAVVRVPTVAALFGVSVPTVWRWTKSGTLPQAIKRGGVTGWRVGDLRAVMTQRT